MSTILEGSLRKNGDRVRIDVRLVSADDGRVLWSSDTFDRPSGDIFALQDEIARSAVAGLRIKLDPGGEQRLVKRSTDNVEAYRAYLMGRYFWNKRTPDGLNKAFEYFQQAIKEDPRYALAYAGLSDNYAASIWFMTQPPKETIAKMNGAAQNAIEFDDTLPEAHIAMSRVYTYDSDLMNGNREIERAIELDPRSAEAHHGYAYGLILVGRADEAITEIKRALELDPLSVAMNVDVGEILLYARRYDEAIEALKKAREMDPHRPNVHHDLAEAYEQKGMEQEAIAEYIEADATVGESQETLAALREAYAVSGIKGFWQKKLDSFKERSKHNYFPPFVIAEVYARLGEKDQAFAWLEKAYAEHSPLILNLKNSAVLDGLRLDPRFADLTHRVFSD